jgi:hypothetical protein
MHKLYNFITHPYFLTFSLCAVSFVPSTRLAKGAAAKLLATHLAQEAAQDLTKKLRQAKHTVICVYKPNAYQK